MDILHIDPDRARADARAGRTEKEWREAEAEEIGLTHRVDALERKMVAALTPMQTRKRRSKNGP